MGRTESPSVIIEQRSLLEDLAHSSQEYNRKFERLKLGLEEPGVEHITRSLPGAPTRKLERKKFTVGGKSLQDRGNTPGLGSKELTTAARSSPKAQRIARRSLETPPNANINNPFINTNVQTIITMPPVQDRGIPTTEAAMGHDQEELFKQLERYSILFKNLLKEVDGAQYQITFKSRLRVKGRSSRGYGSARRCKVRNRDLSLLWRDLENCLR